MFSLVYANYFSSIVKQAFFSYVNHAWICSWNQPVLSNEPKAFCLRKPWKPLMGLELTTDKHPPITSQTRYPLRLAAPLFICAAQPLCLFSRAYHNKMMSSSLTQCSLNSQILLMLSIEDIFWFIIKLIKVKWIRSFWGARDF